MYGIQLAFREYSFTAGITGGKFVGLKYFKQYFESPMFFTTLKKYLCHFRHQYSCGLSRADYPGYDHQSDPQPQMEKDGADYRIYPVLHFSGRPCFHAEYHVCKRQRRNRQLFEKPSYRIPEHQIFWERNPALFPCMYCPASGRPWAGTASSSSPPCLQWIPSCMTPVKLTGRTGGRR